VKSLELEIAEWRSFVERAPAVNGRDLDELEAHLRDQIADLNAAGLADDEAFLIAVKRIGGIDELSREFAREHSGRLWRQLIVADDQAEGAAAHQWLDALVFAGAAAIAVQVVRLAARFPDEVPHWLVRNAAFFVIPFIAGWLARRRALPARALVGPAAAVLAAAVVVNVYPYRHDSTTEILVAAHLPFALWFLLAHPYTGGKVGSHERRMDFVRFTGEWFIYYVLIALGGGVLTGLTAAVLAPTGVKPELVAEWVLPSGAAGAAVIAAWLVESKQRVIENMAPVLTMIFTPLFAVMLAVAAIAYAVTGLGDAFDRELVGVFDALMVVVLGLVLYDISARDPSRPARPADRIQLVAVISALLLDVMVLVTMATRIGDLGFTANRAAALGLNLVLLVNLAMTARLSLRFITGRGSFHAVERWQTTYMPVLAAWAAVVVVVLPVVFTFD
jgi:hypothetical protein